MRKYLLLLAALPFSANAAFVVADVVAGVTQCGVFLDAAPKVVIAVTGTQCKFDVSTVSVGSHTIKMTAITAADPVWGSQESAQSAPFAFARPAAPVTPSGISLTP